MINRLCLVGVGLIGGSIAKTARMKGLCRCVVGVDADPENLRKALDLGIIDEGFAPSGLLEAAQDADWLVLATPVGVVRQVLATLKPVWPDQAIVTDVGSTKQSVIEALVEELGEMPHNFVPGHPIAGAERSGVEAATDDLYQGKRVILTPVRETDLAVLRQVRDFWQAVGAKVSLMEPAHHDQVFAATSHLPHVLAYALVRMLGRKDEQEEIFQYAGAGFRDFSRIASSNPRMWRDICLANHRQIVPMLESLGDELKCLAGLMESQAGEQLHEYFSQAREARERYLALSRPDLGAELGDERF